MVVVGTYVYVRTCVRNRKYLNNGFMYFDETLYVGTLGNSLEPVFFVLIYFKNCAEEDGGEGGHAY